MKKIAAYLLAMLVSVTFAGAQNKRELKLASFDNISFRAPGKLYLRQGSTQKVEIEGDSKYIEELDPRVEGDKFIVGKESGWSWFGNNNDNDQAKVTIWVTIPSFESLSVAGSGDVIGESKFTGSSFDLAVSGSGSLVIDVDATSDLSADVSGSGRIELKGKCRDFESHVSGSGRVRVEAAISERATFGVSGSGKIQARGNARDVKASISGSGEVLAGDLVVENCDVRISGSGGVEINVNKALDANISGSGSVRYNGNPAHVNSHSSGSGKVRKM